MDLTTGIVFGEDYYGDEVNEHSGCQKTIHEFRVSSS